MAREAYREESRENKVSAINITVKEKHTSFYCPNKNCNAILQIRDIGGNPYFASMLGHKHIEKCPYRAGKSYHSYAEKEFNLDKLFAFLMNDSNKQISYRTANTDSNKKENLNNEKSKGPIRTLKNFYYMCKDHSINDTYNGFCVGKMLLDERSIDKFHTKGIFGNKVVECFSHSYSKDTNSITAKIGQYTLILKFNNQNIYNQIKNLIYDNAPKDKFSELPMLVAGNWLKSDKGFNVFETKIFSKKQIAINLIRE